MANVRWLLGWNRSPAAHTRLLSWRQCEMVARMESFNFCRLLSGCGTSDTHN
ncbi:hypothetical protein Hdeb2414_s0002g00066551 [Helianthus debilis subsp. tardiflorus]